MPKRKKKPPVEDLKVPDMPAQDPKWEAMRAGKLELHTKIVARMNKILDQEALSKDDLTTLHTFHELMKGDYY